MSIFNWFRRGDPKVDELLEQTRIGDILRPFYLNDEKINHYFVVYFGDLTAYSRSQTDELAGVLGLGSKVGASQILASLEAEAKAELSKSRTKEKTLEFTLGTLARVILLRTLWHARKTLKPLSQATAVAAPSQLVEATAGFEFCKVIEEAAATLSGAQLKIISDQLTFEQEQDERKHMLLFQTMPPAIALISRRYITAAGKRTLTANWLREQGYFIGTIIENREGVVFLDPLVAGVLAAA